MSLAPHRTAVFPANEQPFVAGARLLALVAFPGEGEGGECARAKNALCAGVIAATKAEDPQAGDAVEVAYPEYAGIPSSEARWASNRIRRRWNGRMLAARASLGFFYEAIAGEPARLPPGMSRLSLNELSKLVGTQGNLGDPHNVEHRIWRKSLPVIHIAAAMQWVLRVIDPGPAPFAYDINRGDLHDAVLDLAAVHEEIVLADRRFGRDRAERLIRLDRTPLA